MLWNCRRSLIGYTVMLCLVVVGCNQATDTPVAEQSSEPHSTVATGGSDADSSKVANNAYPPTQIDADDLNERGEVLLSSPTEANTADVGEDAAGEVAVSNNTGAADLALAPAGPEPSGEPLQGTGLQGTGLQGTGLQGTGLQGTGPSPDIEDAKTNLTNPVTGEVPASLTSSSAASSGRSKLPSEANVATDAERNQKIAEDWPEPQAVLFVSGQQHGYLEPCGCTGLDQQKGGLIRRDTLLSQLADRGWNMVPIDVGNQVRRIGRQPEMKFQSTAEAFKLMQYKAATLGVDDLKLSSVELIQIASSDERNPSPFISANVVLLDPSFFPRYKIVEAGGRKIWYYGLFGSRVRKRNSKRRP